MIYIYDDYLDKYVRVFSYLFARSINERYSFSFIEKSIAYSLMVSELEKSNITTIAFSSEQKIYSAIFPSFENKFTSSIYDEYGWLGFLYVHLFFDLKITFESLFIVLPIKKALEMYSLYHEMDYIHSLEYVKSLIKYSLLDNILKTKHISSSNLANDSHIPLATIKALRYAKRDISKLEANSLLRLANAIGMKMESLLPNIDLHISK